MLKLAVEKLNHRQYFCIMYASVLCILYYTNNTYLPSLTYLFIIYNFEYVYIINEYSG